MKHSLSVFFPAYNEEKNIEYMVIKAREFLEKFVKDYEIIVVDDGSTDDTGKIADMLAKKYKKVRVIHHKKNLGYGVALRTGFLSAKKEFVFYTDSDRQFSIYDLKKFFPYVEEFDLIIGYRKKRQDSFTRRLASKIYNFLVRLILDLNVKDCNCAFKLCRRSIFKKIKLNTTRSADAELLAKAKSYGFRIKQIPVTHYKRKFGKSEAVTYFDIIKPSLAFISIKELFMIRSDIK
jgi:glycosyltransferase involved in cell wall biosynthesis